MIALAAAEGAVFSANKYQPIVNQSIPGGFTPDEFYNYSNYTVAIAIAAAAAAGGSPADQVCTVLFTYVHKQKGLSRSFRIRTHTDLLGRFSIRI